MKFLKLNPLFLCLFVILASSVSADDILKKAQMMFKPIPESAPALQHP